MKIPVFVSCLTVLSDSQEEVRSIILGEMDRLHLEPRSLGRSDYPTEFPLREVHVLAKHCSGGLILGFEQFRASKGVMRVNTKQCKEIDTPMSFPSAWNQLEAGILFSLGLPLLVFKESGVCGGVFDKGVTDLFIHDFPALPIARKEMDGLSEVFLNWHASVRRCYYSE